MMKKIFIILCAILVGSPLFTACEKDYLETRPTDRVPAGAVVETASNAMTALNGLHRALYVRYSSQGRGGLGAFYIHIDEAGEDHVFNKSNWDTSYRWIPNSDPTDSYNKYNWYMFYQWIANANVLINGIDEAAGEQELKDQVKGEALLYRAFFHYELVQLYAARYEKGGNNSQLGIPLRTEPSTEPIARSTVEEVYAQINEDIDTGIALLEGIRVNNKSHLNANVGMGLKARVALTMHEYGTAVTYAQQAREGYSLMDQETYAQGFQIFSENNPEFMWASQIVEDQTDKWANYGAYISRNFSSSAIRGNPRSINKLLYDEIPETDVRKTLWDPTGEHDNLPAGFSLLSHFGLFPYTSQKFIAVSNGDSRVDIPHMRAAEMYLIEAEALARQGGNDQMAAQVLYDLVSTRDDAYTVSSNTGAALMEEIMVERRVELWGEGFRWFDLKRLNKDLDRTGANHEEDFAKVMQIPASDNRWVWPIPQEEIDANPLIEQNPI